MKTARVAGRMLTGTVELRRTGAVRFPIEVLVGDGGQIAGLGRDSSLWIFLGRGRRVVLADGTKWRIKATTSGRHIIPLVKSSEGTIAYAGPLDGRRSYGISGKDFAYTVVPLDRVGWRHAGSWGIRRHETHVARIDQRTRQIVADEPLPIAAALLVYTVVAHGIPGEASLVP